MSENVSVTVFPDGPLKVSHATTVKYCGELLQTDGDVFLCRCGESTNAPFCDGSHKGAGFSGENKSPPTKMVRVWEGETLRTFFNPNACMHVFYCKPLKELRARELQGDTGAAAEIIEVLGACPSGALSYEAKSPLDEPAPRVPDADIEIMEGGEVRVQCAFDINTPLLEGLDGQRATLCRCGLSKNKPWCDGRHSARKDFI